MMKVFKVIDNFYNSLTPSQYIFCQVFKVSVTSTLLSLFFKNSYERFLEAIFVKLLPEKRACRLAQEITRKSFHLCGSIANVLIGRLSDETVKRAGAILIMLSGTIFILETFRLHFKPFNNLYCKYFGSLMRPSEINNRTGMSSFFLGLGLSLRFLDTQQCLFALNCLFLGDTAAAICGISLGNTRLSKRSNKTFEGVLGNLIVCILVLNSLGYQYSAPESLLIVLIPVVAEYVSGDIVPINDNVLIPMSAGFSISLAQLIHQ